MCGPAPDSVTVKAKTTRGMPPRDQTAPGRPSTSVRRAARAQDVGLDPHGHAHALTGPACYRHVEDIAATVQRTATSSVSSSRREPCGAIWCTSTRAVMLAKGAWPRGWTRGGSMRLAGLGDDVDPCGDPTRLWLLLKEDSEGTDSVAAHLRATTESVLGTDSCQRSTWCLRTMGSLLHQCPRPYLELMAK